MRNATKTTEQKHQNEMRTEIKWNVKIGFCVANTKAQKMIYKFMKKKKQTW